MENILIKSSLYDYEVEFVSDVVSKLDQFDNKTTSYVIDRNVYELYQEYFKNLNDEYIYFVDAVEQKKNIDTVLDLVYFWKKIGLKKNWTVVCFGGGIAQDITTFASNIYLRNINWYFFPTTLLAMSDSCIGGKCGINLGEFKNQLGVFYPPKKIFINESFLGTLSEGDYLNGWGEILKFSLTESKSYYDAISMETDYIPCANISKYLYDGLMVKKHIIEADEFEGDLRRVLNYGHTFGHALEAYTHNDIPHGTAVIWGIDVVNYIAMRVGRLSKEDYLEVKSFIKRAFLKHEIEINDSKRILEIVKTDKKVKNNTIYLALLNKISALEIYPMEIDENMQQLFDDYLGETHEYYSH